MGCNIHPYSDRGECSLCTASACTDCMTVIKGKRFCSSCVTSFASGEQVPQSIQTPTHRSPFLTFIRSLVPGLGHLYLGLNLQGIELMALFFGAWWLYDLVGLPFGFVLIITFFFSLFDALQKREKMSKGETIDPSPILLKKKEMVNIRWIGWALIVTGILTFLQKVVKPYFDHYSLTAYDVIGDTFIALVFALIGLAMLRRRTKHVEVE